MTHGGDAYALARTHEFVNDVRTAVGLAGSRRSLNGDVALVEVTDPTQDVVAVITKDSSGGAVALKEPRSFSGEEGQ